jgi:aspartyl-tRNA(Asn)/glutamyl-tRNA(Gln) amidotransferase subunit B
MTVDENVLAKYEMTIGIESHVQLATVTKLFSPADNDARDKAPNTVVHPIDYGLPGMLPVLNRKAVDYAIKAAKAMNARVAPVSRFDRKHYFYPDLPSGYQITQMYQPTILEGVVEAPLENGQNVRVRINHAHLETDAGKLTHYGDYSLADYNRAGTPLIEIVTEPDIHSAEEAKAFCQELHRLMVFAGVSNGDLYHGNQRFDVNISVAPRGAKTLGTRAEIKNLNSFRSIERAIEYEFRRQVALVEQGERVAQETRGWNDAKQLTTSQRSKEDAQDYRYMPDPDIPPIVLTDEEIASIQAQVPMLPPEYRQRWSAMQVDRSVIDALLANQNHARIITEIQEKSGDAVAKRVAHWFASAVDSRSETDEGPVAVVTPSVSVDDLVELANMTESAEISNGSAKEIFNELLLGSDNPRSIAVTKNLLQVSDEGEIAAIVDAVLADPASASALADIREGKDKAIGYLVGQIMKQSRGKANPALAQKLIRERLS